MSSLSIAIIWTTLAVVAAYGAFMVVGHLIERSITRRRP